MPSVNQQASVPVDADLDRTRRCVWASILGLWGTFATAVILQAMLSAPAWASEPMEIVGFGLEAAGEGGEMVRLVVRTSTGLPIDPARIHYKVKDRVARITFEGVPMAASLGKEVQFDIAGVRRVEKGYAMVDGEAGSLVRLRFDAPAEVAIEGKAIETTADGLSILMPFGQAPKEQADLLDAALNDETPAPTAAPQGEPEPAAKVGALGTMLGAPAARGDKAPDGPRDAAPEKTAQGGAPGATPLKLADEARGPSMGRVAVSLGIVALLIVLLAVGTRKLKGAGLGGGPGLRTPVVKVLSTHRIARGVRVLVVDVMGDLLLVSHGQTGLRTLYQIPGEKAALLRGEGSPGAFGESRDQRVALQGTLKGLLGRLSGPAAEVDDAPDDGLHETLDALAASLERPAPALSLIKTRAEDSATGGDAEPADFDAFLSRRMVRDSWRPAETPSGKTDEAEARRSSREPSNERPAGLRPSGGDQELDDVTRSIRSRARALGRL